MNLYHDSPKPENAFWIIPDPSKPFTSSPLCSLQFCRLWLFLFFLCLWSKLFTIFPQSLESWPWIVKRERYMFPSRKRSQCIWYFKSALLALEREGRRSQVQDSRDTAEDRKATHSTVQKRKKKSKLLTLEKSATGLRERACSGRLWSKKRSQVRGIVG